MSLETRITTRIIEEGDTAQLRLDEAELVAVAVAGVERGNRYSLRPLRTRIGSASDCHVVLDDPTVSADHAEVILERERFVLRDRGSKNGIRVNDVRVEGVRLQHGLRVQLGDTTLEVRRTGNQIALDLCAPGEFGPLTVHSAAMRAVGGLIEAMAPSEITVLIEGETGAGKELVARALHDLGPRAAGPFVVADCGAIPPSLIAAELFGAEVGAYTGADRTRRGLIEQASGGTLLLDEIGELPLQTQPVLLGAIERRRARRVGGTAEIRHDARIIAATNSNLEGAARDGSFRADLYYRLAVGRIVVPPLRQRTEDILPLARRFAAEHSARLTGELERLLLAYDWPGNVRELRNVVECAVCAPALAISRLGKTGAGGADEVYLDDERFVALREARKRVVETFEREYLAKVMALSQGHVGNAARLAGISDSLMSRMLSRYGLKKRRGER